MISREVVLSQFMSAIDMLENAMNDCPPELWSDTSRRPEWPEDGVVGFWYLAFHALFWLDLYLSGSVEGFTPPDPFTLDECDPSGRLPDRPYTPSELGAYVAHCRSKCRRTILGATDEALARTCAFMWGEVSFEELLVDNMRHVQHHAAQLNLLLRQHAHRAPRWVATSTTREPGTGKRPE